MLRVRDPFPVVNVLNVLNPGPDLDTRIHLFVRNLQLGPGETAASLVVRLVDSNNQSYDIPAEAVTPLQGTDLSQVTFRLPNGLPEGKCIVEAQLLATFSKVGFCSSTSETGMSIYVKAAVNFMVFRVETLKNLRNTGFHPTAHSLN
ncbi:MAG TPA: hypothetical protein VFD62_18455 [Pyrinomonadaceae bacterium]|nr:hypothetical protein [Pyrinomonadaceae bacterium]